MMAARTNRERIGQERILQERMNQERMNSPLEQRKVRLRGLPRRDRRVGPSISRAEVVTVYRAADWRAR